MPLATAARCCVLLLALLSSGSVGAAPAKGVSASTAAGSAAHASGRAFITAITAKSQDSALAHSSGLAAAAAAGAAAGAAAPHVTSPPPCGANPSCCNAASAITRAFPDRRDWGVMTAIAFYESGWDVTRQSRPHPDGSTDHGLLQLNSYLSCSETGSQRDACCPGTYPACRHNATLRTCASECRINCAEAGANAVSNAVCAARHKQDGGCGGYGCWAGYKKNRGACDGYNLWGTTCAAGSCCPNVFPGSTCCDVGGGAHACCPPGWPTCCPGGCCPGGTTCGPGGTCQVEGGGVVAARAPASSSPLSPPELGWSSAGRFDGCLAECLASLLQSATTSASPLPLRPLLLSAGPLPAPLPPLIIPSGLACPPRLPRSGLVNASLCFGALLGRGICPSSSCATSLGLTASAACTSVASCVVSATTYGLLACSIVNPFCLQNCLGVVACLSTSNRACLAAQGLYCLQNVLTGSFNVCLPPASQRPAARGSAPPPPPLTGAIDLSPCFGTLLGDGTCPSPSCTTSLGLSASLACTTGTPCVVGLTSYGLLTCSIQNPLCVQNCLGVTSCLSPSNRACLAAQGLYCLQDGLAGSFTICLPASWTPPPGTPSAAPRWWHRLFFL